MANLVQRLFSGLAARKNTGNGAIIAQSGISNLSSDAMLRAYNGDLTPNGIGQIEDFLVPIPDQRLYTEAEALRIKQSELIMTEGVKNAKEAFKSAEKMHKLSADLVAARGDLIASAMDDELAKQKANAKLGDHAAKLAIQYGETANQLQGAVNQAELQIQLDTERYRQKGGY
jgi:hypothetical protein